MSVMFVTRLHKTSSVQRKDGKYPIVLQVTWDRKVRRKRLGVFAFEHQFTVYKDKRRKKEKVELSSMKNVQVHIPVSLTPPFRSIDPLCG